MNNKKFIFLIVAVAAITYANALLHDFVGDDYVLFVNNTFYSTLKNLPKIFQPEMIMQFSDVDTASSVGKNSFSGFVSYRPATALTFFSDAFLWRDHPLGYHLTNILLHALVSVLVFFLAGSIIGQTEVAFMAAILFACHPINAEAVNNIGYRSDLLATLFYLLTFIAFIQKHKAREAQKNRWGWICLASFALSLFSKESAVTLLPMLFIYDVVFFSQGKIMERIAKSAFQYLAFLAILIFYLYIYFIVFPNSNSSALFTAHFDFATYAKLVAKIFYGYLKVLLFPFTATVLPPVYAPNVHAVQSYELAAAAIFLLLCSWGIRKAFQNREKGVGFFILWFLITYLPTSNILLLPNPMSFRFMYLPTVGFCFVLAVFIEKAGVYFNRWTQSLDYRKLLQFSLISLYMVVTVPLNMFYRNNFVNCREMIRNYPDCSKPYLNIALLYLQFEQYDKAIESLETYLTNNPNNPFVTVMEQDYFAYHLLGRCYVNDFDKAITYFRKSLSLRPDYIIPYLDLAQVYILKKDFEQSLRCALQAISLDKNIPIGYAYAVHSYMKLGQAAKAQAVLEKARGLFPEDPSLKYLQDHLESLP